MKKSIFIIIALTLSLLLLSACSRPESPPITTETETETEAETEPESINLSLNDIVIEVGATASLSSELVIGENVKSLTYRFEGSDISIENDTVTGLVENTETLVTATADNFTASFTVKVLPAPIIEIHKPDTIKVELNNIILEVGEAITLSSKITIGEEERALTYSFKGYDISIENYVLKGLVKDAQTLVTARAEGFEGTFIVRVTEKITNVVTDPIYKHVVVIGVDGAGTFFQNTYTPNIDSIFANGAITYKCLTSDPTISAQCWGSLLHGVVPSVHGVTNEIAEVTPYPDDSKFPSFFRVIRENDEEAVLASFTGWNAVNRGLIESDINVYKAGGLADSALAEKILLYLEENTPTALFVQFDSVDVAGHAAGFGTAEHLAKITEVDGYIGDIYEAYEQMGILDETLFIVTSDHGGVGVNHGGLTDSEKYVMFAAAGKAVQTGEIHDIEIRDTAAIVLYALGYQNPETWTACVPSGLFEGITAGERPVYVDTDQEIPPEPEPKPETEPELSENT